MGPIPHSSDNYKSLGCQPALNPFLLDDLGNNSASLIIVDALVRYEEFAGALPLVMPGSSSPNPQLSVTVWINGVQQT
jgi:hypothetical protein